MGTPAPSSPARPAPAEAKKVALEAAGVKVGKTPSETARLMRDDHAGGIEVRHAPRGRPVITTGRPFV
jgi:hypothetical protein